MFFWVVVSFFLNFTLGKWSNLTAETTNVELSGFKKYHPPENLPPRATYASRIGGLIAGLIQGN